MEFLDSLAAALVVAGPLAVGVTKVVDFIRNLADADNSAPPWVWNLLAFIVGIAVSLGWGINLVGALTAAVPALAESDVGKGTGGTILTGIVLGAMAGFWHEKMDQWSGWAASRRTVVP